MKNRRTAFGTSIVLALALVLFVSLLVSWYLLRPTEVAFGVPVGVNAISITDQLSSDWGTTSTPTTGIGVSQDGSDASPDAPSANTANDINFF